MYNCQDCMDRLYPFLDRELDDREQLLVREHLSLCRHCLDRVRFEGNVLRAIGTIARSTGCPEEAKVRILSAFGKETAS